MDSIFAQLQLGIAFDKQRFKKDVSLFEVDKSTTDATKTPAATVAVGEQEQQGWKPSTQQGPKRKKKKTAHHSDVAAGPSAAPGIALFSTAAAPGQQQQQQTDGAADAEACGGRAEDLPFTDGAPAVHTGDPFEEANVLRKAHRIKVSGSAPPAPLNTFADLGTKHLAPRRLLQNLAEAGFREPTPIQRQATTALLARRELLAIAPTGSGKTLAFLLPLVMHCKALRAGQPEEGGIKAVVVSPTKELMMQSGRVLKQLLPGLGLRASILTKATAAGTEFDKVDILLANPLRLGAMASKKEHGLDLSRVRTLVLDEADKLFGMGFTEQVDTVLAECCHKDVVRALFSATLPEQVETLARSVLQYPLRVTVGERNTAAATVKQRLLFVGRESGKLLALRQLVREGLKPPVLVFVATKERAKELHRELMFDGVHVDSIHADQSQAARQAAVDNFRIGRTWVLVATDLIGRGMDFLGVNTVINYDFPNSTTDYIHRVGRTGRAGRSGEAITFFEEEDAGQLRGIANVMRAAGCEVPEWMLQLKKERRRKRKAAAPASGISTEPGLVAKQQKKQRRQQAQQQQSGRTQAAEAGAGVSQPGRQQAGAAGEGKRRLRRGAGEKRQGGKKKGAANGSGGAAAAKPMRKKVVKKGPA